MAIYRTVSEMSYPKLSELHLEVPRAVHASACCIALRRDGVAIVMLSNPSDELWYPGATGELLRHFDPECRHLKHGNLLSLLQRSCNLRTSHYPVILQSNRIAYIIDATTK